MRARFSPAWGILLWAAGHAFAAPEPRARALLPDYLRVQLAGATGLLSLGLGYTFSGGRVEPELLYGFVPEAVGGVAIHTLAQKSTLAPVRFDLPRGLSLAPLAGYSLNACLGENYDLYPTGRYAGYYGPSGLHFWIFAGMRVDRDLALGPVRAASLAVEAGTLEDYFMPWWDNREIGPGDVFSLALAVQTRF